VLHHDSVGSATPPTNSTPAISQPAIQQAPAYSPLVNPKPPVQTPNLAAMKQQADALTNQNNFAQAATLYEELCLAGNGPSCNRAGYQYQNGLGVKVDDARAANLYSRSCNFGYPNGCSNLGNLYRQGLGVPRNLVLARQYLTQGCNMGNPFGCNVLKQLQ
jgi:TPR repeat protein